MTDATSAWTDIAAEDDLFDGDVVGIQAGGRDLAVYLVDGQPFATDNLCTHGNARLCDGFLEGHEIECPFHQGRFDIRNGQPTCAPATEAVRTYPVQIVSGRVQAQLGD